MASVALLDYGSSNLRSVAKALAAAAPPHTDIRICTGARELRAADRIVFPGQGAIGQCMGRLHELGLVEALDECLRSKPFLGICLGLQSLMTRSEENGGTDCLGIVPGTVRRFGADSGLKVPHMGWNQVRHVQPHVLWQGIAPDTRFYFVHSYYVEPGEAALAAGTTDYGITFTAALARGNLFAVQFHPEKSQQAGLTLLANFMGWRP